MVHILSGGAAPEAIGALLMLMRYRGETAEEIAGFVEAMRASANAWSVVQVDVDWPVYAAGRSRGLPLLLLSAKLLARAGYRVLLHGWNSHQGPVADVRAALPHLGIAKAQTASKAADILMRDRIAYTPLEAISPKLLELIRLRTIFGLRSPINTALRAFNPALAELSLQGVFHPAYRDLQRDAAMLLKQSSLIVLKGAGGEFERHPSKDIALRGIREGSPFDMVASALTDETRTLKGEAADPYPIGAIWAGDLIDEFATSVVTGTTALVLGQREGFAKAQIHAETLWENRHRAVAA